MSNLSLQALASGNVHGVPGGSHGQASADAHVNAMDLSKLKLYRMIAAQLEADGFQSESKAIAQKLSLVNMPQSAVPTPALSAVVGAALGSSSENISSQKSAEWVPLKCRPVPPLSHKEEFLDYRDPSKSAVFGAVPFEDSEMIVQNPSKSGASVSDGQGSSDYCDRVTASREDSIPSFAVRYATTHKSAVTCVEFSSDGRLCASGSTDTSVKVFETAKMLRHSMMSGLGGLGSGSSGADALTASMIKPLSGPGAGQSGGGAQGGGSDDLKPIIRTFYDHVSAVTALCFHPRLPLLFTGSADKTVKLFDLTRAASNKKAQRSMTDSYGVQSLACHPCGDFLFVGTAHPALRVYDIRTQQCYSSLDSRSLHGQVENGLSAGNRSASTSYLSSPSTMHLASMSGINSMCVSDDGSVIITGGGDGSIVTFDSVSCRGVNRISAAHSGQPVTSVKLSRCQRYLLTAGADLCVRVYDLRNASSCLLSALVPSHESLGPVGSKITAHFSKGEQLIYVQSPHVYSSGAEIVGGATGVGSGVSFAQNSTGQVGSVGAAAAAAAAAAGTTLASGYVGGLSLAATGGLLNSAPGSSSSGLSSFSTSGRGALGNTMGAGVAGGINTGASSAMSATGPGQSNPFTGSDIVLMESSSLNVVMPYLSLHTAPVRSMAANGQLILSGSDDGRFRLISTGPSPKVERANIQVGPSGHTESQGIAADSYH